MNKQQFMDQLSNALKKVPKTERQDILQDYEEHFTIGIADGKREKEIAAALGSPIQIAKELHAMYHLDKVETSRTAGNFIRATWSIIGLSFFNLLIVLAPFIAFISIVFSGWIAGAAFTASPLIVIGAALFTTDSFEWFNLFASLLLCGAGLFILIAMYYVSRTLTNWFVRYLKYNASFVKGGIKHD